MVPETNELQAINTSWQIAVEEILRMVNLGQTALRYAPGEQADRADSFGWAPELPEIQIWYHEP